MKKTEFQVKDMKNKYLPISTEIVDDKNDEHRFRKLKQNEKTAVRVSMLAILSNVILSVFKLVAGIVGKSYAMVADSVHSISDVLTTVVVIIGVKISAKKADRSHPYGHDRFECITALILAFVLFDVGLLIGYDAVSSLISGEYLTKEVPKLIALIAAVVSILMQLILFIVTRIVAKKINSGALKADAWHHLSDSLSSIGSFVGILGAMLGVSILDVLAGIVICIVILKVAIDIFMDSVKKVTDTSAPESIQEKIKEIVLSVEGVERIDSLRTRLFGSMVYIDVEIACDGRISLFESHEIAQKVHDKIESEIDTVKHCLVHTNPETTNEMNN